MASSQSAACHERCRRRASPRPSSTSPSDVATSRPSATCGAAGLSSSETISRRPDHAGVTAETRPARPAAVATSERRNGARGLRAGVRSEAAMHHTLTRLRAADRLRIVCSVQVDEALDPRCYAPVGIEPRTRALLTAVPYRGELIREGSSSRRERPFWAITLRAVGGPAAGVHAELRLWPESNPQWFRSRLAVLCDADLALITGLTGEQQRTLLERNLGEHSYTGFLETAADGLADVSYLELARPRIEVPPELAASPPARPVPPPEDAPETPSAPPALHAHRGSAGARRAVRAARARRRARRRHRDRLRAARRPAGLVARRRRGAPAAGGRSGRRRDGLRRRRLLPGRSAPAPAPARRRSRDHRPQRPLRAVVADLALRPRPLEAGLRHELRVPRLRAPLVDPGSVL